MKVSLREGFRMDLYPIVYRKGKVRKGKGFSRDELRAVELSLKEALKMGIPVDPRRKSRHEENVNLLKQFLETKLKNKASIT